MALDKIVQKYKTNDNLSRFKEGAKSTLKALLGIGQPWYNKALLLGTYVSIATGIYSHTHDWGNTHTAYYGFLASTFGTGSALTNDDVQIRIMLLG